MSTDDERRSLNTLRATMLAATFAGGYLLAVITTGLGLPPVLHPPVILVVYVGLLLYFRRTP